MARNNPESSGVLLGYFPVIHRGYLSFINNHPEKDIGVLDTEVLDEYDYLRKDIRALRPIEATELLRGIGRNAELIGSTALLTTIQRPGLVMPDDDISRSICVEFGVSAQFEPVFLRWDRRNTSANMEITPDRVINQQEINHLIIEKLQQEASRSTNWWRHVAAAIVVKGSVECVAHNSSMPTPYSSAIDGDPRITEKRGKSVEKSIDIHAEARIIAQRASEGLATKGAEIFVTTFPCANCAKLIVESGFSACYYVEGYANIDGQSILKSAGIEIIKVNVDFPKVESDQLLEYPTSNLS